jgi:flagellar M-ring protein FliF
MAAKKNESLFAQAAKGLNNLPIVRQLILMAGLAASIAMAVSLVLWLQDPNYRPLFHNLDTADMAIVADSLQQAGIKYKVSDRDGAILVPAGDLHKARIQLTSAGLPKSSGLSFAILEKNNSIGTSRFVENARYLHALEGELARTIAAIQGVSSARVHLAMPKNSVFVANNKKPTASVFLEMSSGYVLDEGQVNAIAQLVASSILDLHISDVAITDQHGKLLTEDINSDLLLSREQLSYQQKMQEYFETRIETMIRPLLGINKAQVRVFANLDFTHEEKTKEAYDNAKNPLRSEQSVNEESSGGGAGGVPGAASNSPPAAGASTGGGNSSRNESIKNYEVGKEISYTKSPTGKLQSLSVAVVVDDESIVDPESGEVTQQPVPQEKLDKLTELVKAAVGFDEERGDKVSVVNSRFAPPPAIEAMPSLPLWEQAWFWDVLKKSLGVLVALIIFFGVVKPILRGLATKANQSDKPKAAAAETDELGGVIELTPEMQRLKEEQINSLKQIAVSDPMRVAGVLKNWVGE